MKAIIGMVFTAALLAGCNTVVTPTPLLTMENRGTGPALRLGVWRFEMTDACDVDETKPLGDWPQCANGLMLKDGGVAGYYDRAAGSAEWKMAPLIFAPGTPGIIEAQVNLGGDIKTDATPYAYAAARTTRSDDQGRITAIVVWPVLCGPPPPGANAGLTKHLLRGLTAKPDDPVCTTSSVQALREAAKASESWAEKTVKAHWVRDGGP